MPRGETTGFASWYATLWFEEPLTLRAFRSLLGVQRFFGGGRQGHVGGAAGRECPNQQDVTDRLGYQVREAVEEIIPSLDRIDQDQGRRLLEGVSESELYEAALTVMMRLVFLFYAEENKLIPSQVDEPDEIRGRESIKRFPSPFRPSIRSAAGGARPATPRARQLCKDTFDGCDFHGFRQVEIEPGLPRLALSSSLPQPVRATSTALLATAPHAAASQPHNRSSREARCPGTPPRD